MALKFTGTPANRDFEVEIIPAGLHPAICYAVVDLGHQHNITFDKWQQKVMLVFELPKQVFEHPLVNFLHRSMF